VVDLTLLITGGTGCFGQAFTRYALAHDARRVIVYSRDEEKQRRMREAIPDERLDFFLGDVRDGDDLRRAMQAVGLDVVCHAAALKQIDQCEANPLQTMKTNVKGSANVINAALDVGVPKVLAISTDKAVQATTVYGASKAMMERLMVAANVYRGSHGTRFSCVRYGNVLSSTGSVVPKWQQQAARGEPLTVTEPNCTRFFWTLDTAVAFTAQAIRAMEGSEIFVPMLRACRIGDLADAISSSQVVTGIRPTEKLHEILIAPDEPAKDDGWAWVIGHGSPPFGRAYTSDTVPRMTAQEVIG